MTPAGAVLQARLVERCGGWPGRVEHHERLASTNDRAKELARQGAPEWSAVVADEQTAGRGRHGRTWASPPGNLYLSVLLRPPATALERLTLVGLAAGVAVVDALAEHGVVARLKWPNDVVADGRKLAGVLAEASTSGSGVESVVVGCGVNLLAAAAWPAELRGAIAAVADLGATVDRAELAAALLEHFRERQLVARADPDRAVAEWRARALDWWGRPVEVRCGGQLLRGTAHGIDERGALLLRSPLGEVRAVLSGEVSELRRRGGDGA